MLTELTFCRKSSIIISIDDRYYNRFIHLGRPIFPVNHNGGSLCLQYRLHLGTRMRVYGCNTREAPVTQFATWVGSSRISTASCFTVASTHHISNNCIYFQSHLLAGTNPIAIDLMTMKDWFFSQHRPPAPRHQQSCHLFLLAVVTAGDCAMTSIPRAPENMTHKKHNYNLFQYLDAI